MDMLPVDTRVCVHHVRVSDRRVCVRVHYVRLLPKEAPPIHTGGHFRITLVTIVPLVIILLGCLPKLRGSVLLHVYTTTGANEPSLLPPCACFVVRAFLRESNNVVK